MNLYEFITPSDPITFEAENDKIAYACSIFLGNGRAGCTRYEDGKEVNLPTMVAFQADAKKSVEEYLGASLTDFLNQHSEEMGKCFLSFAYGHINDRKQYNDACEAITDPIKLKEFKAKQEDRQRSSLSQWVLSAWKFGEKMKTEQTS